MVQVVNSSLTGRTGGRRSHPRTSAADRFEAAYGRCRAALGRRRDPDLSADELALLHRLGVDADGVALTWLAAQLEWPKSTTSVVVKDLERRGLVRRTRRSDDERRLAIVRTPAGAARAAEDRVFEPRRLGAALRALPAPLRAQLLDGVERLAAEAERLPSDR
jgi:DNA-binding MarR family transcriptional regulator